MVHRQAAAQINSCPVCGSNELHQDRQRGEQICRTCGSVITSNMIDSGPEWRAFTAEERNARARTGSPMSLLLPDKGLSTTMGWSNRDASGRQIGGSKRAQLYRMRKWHRRSIFSQSQTRNLSIALSDMDRLASQLGIFRDIKETASKIYRRALARKLVRGRSIESMVAASLYISCRLHQVPRRLDEVCKEANIERSKLGQAVRHIIRYTDLKLPIPSATNLLPRISSDAGISGKTVQEAAGIINKAKEIGLTAGKDPGGIAAAALYIAGILSDDRHTQREIAVAARVTEVTVRNRYKEMVKKMKLNPL